jgi:hypothetical protein
MIQRFIERSFHDLAIGSSHALRARIGHPRHSNETYPWKMSGG